MLKVAHLVCGLEILFEASGAPQTMSLPQNPSLCPQGMAVNASYLHHPSWHFVNVCLPMSHLPTRPTVSSMGTATSSASAHCLAQSLAQSSPIDPLAPRLE